MKITGVKNDALWLACEQALPGALVEGQEKEGELATTSPIPLWLPVKRAVRFLPNSAKQKQAQM